MVALILAGIFGIALVSYLRLSTHALRLADRSFYANSAMNLAEIGLEEAITAFNQIDNVGAASAFADWSKPGGTAGRRTFPADTPFALGANTTGTVKVYTTDCTGAAPAPLIVAKAIVTPPNGNGPPIYKYIEISLRKRSLFANGLVAREDVTWVGHPLADSWNSDPAGDGSTIVPYNASLRTANIVVGCLTGNIGLGSGGEVWGYAKTGPTGTISGGSVHGLGTTDDDPSRRTNDFNSTFPPVSVPTATANVISSSITNTTSFPRGGDVSVTVGGVATYYYTFTTGNGISLSGSRALNVNANCVFILTSHAPGTSISTSGNAYISIANGSTLNIYTNGNVSIGGNGLINNNTQPKQCVIWGTGTATGTQAIDISGNGQLKACVYAPNAALSLNGGGSAGHVMGAAVARTISMNGGTEFHYDDSLGNLTTGNPFAISKWRELQSATERALYESYLSF